MLPPRRAAWIALGLSFTRASLAAENGANSLETLPAVALDYEAVDGCPSAEQFADALVARGVSVEATKEASAVRVRIAAATAGFSGVLSISSMGGPFLVRNLDASNCDEITAAFALVAAITVTHTSRAEASAPSAAEPLPAPVAAPPPPLETPKPPTEAVKSRAQDVTPPPESVPAPASRQSGPPPFALGLGATLQQGVLPEFGAGALLYAKRAWRGGSGFSPAALLGVGWSRQELVRIGRARFDWLSLRASLCPWQWQAGEHFELGPCLAVETGILRGEGYGVRDSASSTAWWLAPGLGLRAEARLGRWLIAVSGGASLPLFRDRFYFGPNVTLYRPSLVTLGSELSLGLGFW